MQPDPMKAALHATLRDGEQEIRGKYGDAIPLWQYNAGVWTDYDAATSAQIELQWLNSNTRNCMMMHSTSEDCHDMFLINFSTMTAAPGVSIRRSSNLLPHGVTTESNKWEYQEVDDRYQPITSPYYLSQLAAFAHPATVRTEMVVWTGRGLYLVKKVDDRITQYNMKSSVGRQLRRVSSSGAPLPIDEPREPEYYSQELEEHADKMGIPPEFICLLSKRIMVDPVLCDGSRYEKYFITRWVANAGISPKTGAPLQDSRIMEDATMRTRIQEFMQQVKMWVAPLCNHCHDVATGRPTFGGSCTCSKKKQKKN